MPAIFPEVSKMQFSEPHDRFCVIRHEELPDGHKAAYRISGIDPDRAWCLVWSFPTIERAIATLEDERKEAPEWRTFEMVDMAHSRFCLTGKSKEVQDAIIGSYVFEKRHGELF